MYSAAVCIFQNVRVKLRPPPARHPPAITDHDADLDATVAMLVEAGMVEEYVNEDGKPALRLTTKGAQMGRTLAMAGDDADPEAVLEALLETS